MFVDAAESFSPGASEALPQARDRREEVDKILQEHRLLEAEERRRELQEEHLKNLMLQRELARRKEAADAEADRRLHTEAMDKAELNEPEPLRSYHSALTKAVLDEAQRNRILKEQLQLQQTRDLLAEQVELEKLREAELKRQLGRASDETDDWAEGDLKSLDEESAEARQKTLELAKGAAMPLDPKLGAIRSKMQEEHERNLEKMRGDADEQARNGSDGDVHADEAKDSLETDTKKKPKTGLFGRLAKFVGFAFHKISSRFSAATVDEAVAKVTSREELAVEYLRCLNVGDARTNFRRGEAFCRTISDDSHRKFCGTLVQMAMQILRQIQLCQRDRRGTQRRACFFKVKAPLMHPTLVEIGSNLHEEYIEGFMTRAPDFRVVPDSVVSQIHHHFRQLNWREILLHSFDVVAISASNRLWHQTYASLHALSSSRLVEKQRAEARQHRAFRFHRRQQAILEMTPHPDPLLVGILHELVFRGNVCQHKSDYKTRIIREVGGKRVVTTVKEQTKLAFIHWIQSLYSVEECMHPPFLRPSERGPEDEDLARQATAGPVPPSLLSGPPAENADEKLFHMAPSPIQVQNCELVRTLFRLSFDKSADETNLARTRSESIGDESADGESVNDAASENSEPSLEGDEPPKPQEEEETLAVPLTEEQRIARRAFVQSLNTVVSSTATLSASILLNKTGKGYKVLEFVVRSRFVARLLASFAFKLVVHLFSETYDFSAVSAELDHVDKYPRVRSRQETDWWQVVAKTVHNGALPLQMSDVFASSYVQSLGATVEILTGKRNVAAFATQVLVTALRRRRQLWKRMGQSGYGKTRDGDLDRRLGEESESASSPGIGRSISRSRSVLKIFGAVTSAILCSLLIISAGAWAIPLLIAAAIVAVTFLFPGQPT